MDKKTNSWRNTTWWNSRMKNCKAGKHFFRAGFCEHCGEMNEKLMWRERDECIKLKEYLDKKANIM